MGTIKQALGDMPDIVISVLIVFAVLMIGGLFMYKTASVAGDVITTNASKYELVQRADAFNTTGDSISTVITTVVSLIVVFVLFALIFFLVKALRSSDSGGKDML